MTGGEKPPGSFRVPINAYVPPSDASDHLPSVVTLQFK
jgi:hypothetical protein